MQNVFHSFEKKNRNTGRTIKRIKESFRKGDAESALHQARYIQEILDGVMRCAKHKDGDEGVDIGITYAEETKSPNYNKKN